MNQKWKIARAKFYIGGRPSAEQMQFRDGNNFKLYWCPRLRGKFVMVRKFKHLTKKSAINEAKRFLTHCENIASGKRKP